MDPKRTKFLLDELCVGLGFCLSAEAQSRVLEKPPSTVDAFTDAVMIAEGMVPEYEPQRRKQVRAVVAKYFDADDGRIR